MSHNTTCGNSNTKSVTGDQHEPGVIYTSSCMIKCRLKIKWEQKQYMGTVQDITNMAKGLFDKSYFSLITWQKRQQIQQSSEAEQSQSQHLAIYAAANNNIWIRWAELKGKNVIWALQQQLENNTENPHTQGKNIIFQSRHFHILGACHPKYLFVLVSPHKVQFLIPKTKCIQ